MIRPATIYDVPRIQEIINSHAELGRMLFKSLAQLFESLRDFAVYEDEETGRVVGCCALTIIWADLAEVRSLAVEEGSRGKGIGRTLVGWTIDEARRLGIRKIMSLTYEQRFFEKIGFEVVPEDGAAAEGVERLRAVPERDGCDEIAMVCTLHDVPVPEGLPVVPPTPRGVSIPVLGHVED